MWLNIVQDVIHMLGSSLGLLWGCSIAGLCAEPAREAVAREEKCLHSRLGGGALVCMKCNYIHEHMFILKCHCISLCEACAIGASRLQSYVLSSTSHVFRNRLEHNLLCCVCYPRV